MIILLGVPGSGKSTQGKLLAGRGKLRWISMGDILRQQATEAQLKQMAAGKLLGDDEIITALQAELAELGDEPEMIIDGFPRKAGQSEWLLQQHRAGRLKISAVVSLYAAREVVKKRLMLRGRSDDNRQTIDNRFDIYESTSTPTINILKTGGIPIIEINADQAPEAILIDIVAGLKQFGIRA
jgi:adenylate kinase